MIKFNLFVTCVLTVIPKTPLPNSKSHSFTTVFSSKSLEIFVELMLVYVRKQRVQLHSFACAYTVVPCSLSSAGKEAARHVGDPGSIPGSGRSTAEGIGYPLQCFWASLEAQLVKNLPAMWDTWVQSLGWEDPLEKGKATHSSILAWRIPWTV